MKKTHQELEKNLTQQFALTAVKLRLMFGSVVSSRSRESTSGCHENIKTAGKATLSRTNRFEIQ